MTTSTLAIAILISTIIYFVVSKSARRAGSENQSLILLSRLMAVLILGLTLYYFSLRMTGS